MQVSGIAFGSFYHTRLIFAVTPRYKAWRTLWRVVSEPMRQLDEIASDVPGLIQPLLSEAYEAGRKAGYQEASAALKAKLFGVLKDGSDEVALPTESSFLSEGGSVSGDEPDSALTMSDRTTPRRATPGSVKPAILKYLSDSRGGLSVDDIVTATGFKPNSVRGTLWTLGNEGSASKRLGKWFISGGQSEDPEVDPENKLNQNTLLEAQDTF